METFLVFAALVPFARIGGPNVRSGLLRVAPPAARRAFRWPESALAAGRGALLAAGILRGPWRDRAQRP